MEGIEPILAAERRAKRVVAMRMKQFVSSVSTLSYGALAGSLVEPLAKHETVLLLNVVISITSVAALALCIAVAPWTEVEHGRI